jgi:hypothetical protein
MITAQQIFDDTVRHLHAQGGPAREPDGSGCMYLAPDGRKCSVGYWIPKDRYTPRIEGLGTIFDGAALIAELEPCLPPELHPHADLLHELQAAHDNSASQDRQWIHVQSAARGIAWKLEWLAGRLGLDPGVVYACWPREQKGNVA